MQAEADPSGCSLKLCERCLVCYDVRSEDTLLPFTPMASSGCSRAADPESEATESRSKLDEARIYFPATLPHVARSARSVLRGPCARLVPLCCAERS